MKRGGGNTHEGEKTHEKKKSREEKKGLNRKNAGSTRRTRMWFFENSTVIGTKKTGERGGIYEGLKTLHKKGGGEREGPESWKKLCGKRGGDPRVRGGSISCQCLVGKVRPTVKSRKKQAGDITGNHVAK